MESEVYIIGSDYRFSGVITKNSVAWDLTNAVVTLYFNKPDGTSFSIVATKDDALNGLVHVDVDETQLDIPGNWQRIWYVDDNSTIQEEYPPIDFIVRSSKR